MATSEIQTSTIKILCVDDEIEVLNSIKRLFRKEYEVFAYTDPLAALENLADHEYAVIISDMRMPNMSGAEFLHQACERYPDTPRILLTGYADMESTADAVNLGRITNYINKPWQNEELKHLVSQAVGQFQLKKKLARLEAELKEKNRQLTEHNSKLEHVVEQRTQSLMVLTEKLKTANQKQRSLVQDIIEMINLIVEDITGESKGHVKRVASHCRAVAQKLNLDKNTVTHCYLAGLMHEIGKLAIDPALNKAPDNNLTRAQLAAKQLHAVKGAEILEKVPHLRGIADAIRHQYEHFDGSGVPSHYFGENIPIESRILSVVNEYDKLLIGRKTSQHVTQAQAVNLIKAQAKTIFDPAVIEAYFSLLEDTDHLIEIHFDSCVGVNMLKVGMHLAQDLHNKQGAILLTEGTEITPAIIEKLKQYQKEWNYILNIFVH